MPDDRVFREFTAFGLELARFAADDWDAFFPGLSPTGSLFGPRPTARRRMRCTNATRPPTTERSRAPGVRAPTRRLHRRLAADARSVGQWIEQGNDLKAAVVLARAGDPSAGRHVDHLVDRLAAVLRFR